MPQSVSVFGNGAKTVKVRYAPESGSVEEVSFLKGEGGADALASTVDLDFDCQADMRFSAEGVELRSQSVWQAARRRSGGYEIEKSGRWVPVDFRDGAWVEAQVNGADQRRPGH
jgi:hypothetical protein